MGEATKPSLTKVSLEVSGFAVSGLAVSMGEAIKPFLFRSCQNVKIGRSLARDARFQALTCLLLGLWLSSSFAVSMGEATKPFLVEVVKISKLEESRTNSHLETLTRYARLETLTCLLWSLWLHRVYGGG